MAPSDTPPGYSQDAGAGTVTGKVAALLRLEGAVVLVVAVLCYWKLGASWWFFAILFFVPDVSMLGYVVGRGVGAAVYNAGHTYLAPAVLAAVGLATGLAWIYPAALIWAGHIGFDRMLGYGLKYPRGFGATHLSGKSNGTSV